MYVYIYVFINLYSIIFYIYLVYFVCIVIRIFFFMMPRLLFQSIFSLAYFICICSFMSKCTNEQVCCSLPCMYLYILHIYALLFSLVMLFLFFRFVLVLFFYRLIGRICLPIFFPFFLLLLPSQAKSSYSPFLLLLLLLLRSAPVRSNSSTSNGRLVLLFVRYSRNDALFIVSSLSSLCLSSSYYCI